VYLGTSCYPPECNDFVLYVACYENLNTFFLFLILFYLLFFVYFLFSAVIKSSGSVELSEECV